jgi:hypothetical protein
MAYDDLCGLAAGLTEMAAWQPSGCTGQGDDGLLVTEAALHHLDLVEHLDAPGPSAGPLAVVRRTLDGLLGRPAPPDWDDITWALVGTGRRPLAPHARTALGADADRLPLLS